MQNCLRPCYGLLGSNSILSICAKVGSLSSLLLPKFTAGIDFFLNKMTGPLVKTNLATGKKTGK